MSAGLPGLLLLVSAPRTSLLPIQAVTKVGSASSIAWSWVRPPRMKVVRALLLAKEIMLSFGENDVAPGTATLLTYGIRSLARRSQVLAVPPPTRVCVTLLVSGGAQPRPWRDGT